MSALTSGKLIAGLLQPVRRCMTAALDDLELEVELEVDASEQMATPPASAAPRSEANAGESRQGYQPALEADAISELLERRLQPRASADQPRRARLRPRPSGRRAPPQPAGRSTASADRPTVARDGADPSEHHQSPGARTALDSAAPPRATPSRVTPSRDPHPHPRPTPGKQPTPRVRLRPVSSTSTATSPSDAARPQPTASPRTPAPPAVDSPARPPRVTDSPLRASTGPFPSPLPSPPNPSRGEMRRAVIPVVDRPSARPPTPAPTSAIEATPPAAPVLPGSPEHLRLVHPRAMERLGSTQAPFTDGAAALVLPPTPGRRPLPSERPPPSPARPSPAASSSPSAGSHPDHPAPDLERALTRLLREAARRHGIDV